MKVALLAAVGAIALQTLPAVAQSSVNDLHTALQQAVCLNDWDAAIAVTSQLIGSHEITADSRQEYVQFRHQLQEWRLTHASLQMEGCEEIVALAASDSPTEPQPTPSPVDWSRAVSTLSSSRTTAERRSQPVSSSPLHSGATPNLSCPPSEADGVRVASGTISTRWGYEIWQTGLSFYVRYWEQANPCRVRETFRGYSTQREAYEAFREGIGETPAPATPR